LKYLLVCIGNRDGGDDAVGPFIADELGNIKLNDIEVLNVETYLENYTGVIKQKKPDILYLIDAIDMNLNPGEIRIVPKEKIGLMHVSTHGIPLSVFVNYLSQYISKIAIIGIQPQKMDGDMTRIVKKNALKLIEIFKNEEFSLIKRLE
jgi:hydrogenase 3 maturation protease